MSTKPYQMTGTPEKNSGTRLLSVEETFKLLEDPEIRKAIDTIEKVEGKPRAVTMMAIKALKRQREVDMHVAEQKRAIDLAKMKHEGKLG